MSGEDPKKVNPVDRLFEKPATKFDSPVQQALYDHLIAEEAEIQRLRKAAVDALAAWQPPTDVEFSNWLTPDDAVGGLTGRIEDGPKKRRLLERLRGGAIIGVARQSQARGLTTSFTLVPPRAWEFLDDHDQQFWEFGDVSVVVQEPARPTGKGGQHVVAPYRERYFEVRFHPDDFSGGARPRQIPALPEDPPSGEMSEARADARPTSPELPQLSKADAERLCRALLTEWPDMTQDFAHEKAVGFFADKKVPRDWFRSILRSIRGAQKPGKKPKTEQ